MASINVASAGKGVYSVKEREDQIDRVDLTQNQISHLTLDLKKKIKEVTEEVAKWFHVQ